MNLTYITEISLDFRSHQKTMGHYHEHERSLARQELLITANRMGPWTIIHNKFRIEVNCKSNACVRSIRSQNIYLWVFSMWRTPPYIPQRWSMRVAQGWMTRNDLLTIPIYNHLQLPHSTGNNHSRTQRLFLIMFSCTWHTLQRRSIRVAQGWMTRNDLLTIPIYNHLELPTFTGNNHSRTQRLFLIMFSCTWHILTHTTETKHKGGTRMNDKKWPIDNTHL